MKTKFSVESEGYATLQEVLNTIPLAAWLAGDRPYAKDMPRDSEGRIIVDVVKPHRLEHMDYFTKVSKEFDRSGKYTNAYPSKDPNSPYRKFWDREVQRCKYGMVRKTDGEWITGFHYYYLNYSRIMKTVITGKRGKDGSVQADRIEAFPDFWDGDYMFFHYIDQAYVQGKYGTVLKARGKGFSYKASAMLARNYELFGKSKSYAFASDTEYLDTDGILSKAWDNIDFVTKHVGFARKLRLKDTSMHKKAGYKRPGDPAERGARSEVIGVTMKNNPGKARGKRSKLILWEEAGIFPNILKSWRIAQRSLEDGNRVFGIMISFGTGGEVGANFEGLESMFYNPDAYNILQLNNVFDKNADKAFCGMFIPDYLNRADCYDKDGNSNVIRALEEIIEKRLKLKYSSIKQEDISQAKAEGAITPQEAVMRIEGTVFPIEELKMALAEILPSLKTFTASHYIGNLFWKGPFNVEFKPDLSAVPIREWPIKDVNSKGAIEIFEPPKRDAVGEVPRGRYIAGVDSVDDEYGTSMFSMLVLDLFTDNIVAEWTGRYRTANQNFDTALKLAIYYNAQINYENKLKGMFSYFDKKNALGYLCDTPMILQDMDYVSTKERYGNKRKGTPPTGPINVWGRRLQADWMLGVNEYYNDLNYKHIRTIGYMREAISWNRDGNFDRVSAGNMLFILREDKIKLVAARDENQAPQDDYSEDDFFTDEELEGEYDFAFETY